MMHWFLIGGHHALIKTCRTSSCSMIISSEAISTYKVPPLTGTATNYYHNIRRHNSNSIINLILRRLRITLIAHIRRPESKRQPKRPSSRVSRILSIPTSSSSSHPQYQQHQQHTRQAGCSSPHYHTASVRPPVPQDRTPCTHQRSNRFQRSSPQTQAP